MIEKIRCSINMTNDMKHAKPEKYGDYYLAWKENRGLKKPYSTRTINTLKHFISGDVLEIGPGNGDTIKLLFTSDIKSYTAIEPDEQLFEETKRKIEPLGIQKNLFKDIFPSDSLHDKNFDAIISLEVIEHTVSPDEFLKECRKLLKPSGYIILSTPNRYIYRFIAKLADGGTDPTHINEMTFNTDFHRRLNVINIKAQTLVEYNKIIR